MSEAKVSATTTSQSVPPMYGGVVLRKGLRGRPTSPQTPVSRDAQRLAAVILEVLAGVRTPTEAAAAVSLSVPRYYLWEQRALEGLVRACELRPVGKAAHERHQMAVLEKEVIRLRQDCARHQALVRASQRTIGLAGPPQAATKPAAKPGSKATAGTAAPARGSRSAGGVTGKAKRKRRPVARALKAVAALQAPAVDHECMVPETVADSVAASSVPAVEVVQRSVSSSSWVTAEAATAVAAVLET